MRQVQPGFIRPGRTADADALDSGGAGEGSGAGDADGGGDPAEDRGDSRGRHRWRSRARVPMAGMNSFDPVDRRGPAAGGGQAAADPALQIRVAGISAYARQPADRRAATSPGPTSTRKGRWRSSRRTWRAKCGAAPAGAIGKRIRESTAGPWREVVGRGRGLERDDGVDQPAPDDRVLAGDDERLLGQSDFKCGAPCIYIVRSARTGSQGFLNEIRQAVWSVNPDLPLCGVKTMQEIYTQVDGADVVRAGDAGDRGRRWRCCWA